MVKEEIYLVTAALPYVNYFPHLGHIVGCHLPADIFARYLRLKGKKVLFVGGTDEHGTPTEVTAYSLNVSPKELCDKMHEVHKKIYEWFKISYDIFSRTTKEIHYKVTKEFFLRIFENGYVLEREIILPYCPNCKRYLPDRYVEGVCPYCGYEHARGDQCEHCGRLLDPAELKNPRCKICGNRNLEFKKVRHLFLDLSKLEEKLRKWIEGNKHWREHVVSMALGWIKEGLKPRCITRDIKWGVPVPYKELWEITKEKIKNKLDTNSKEKFIESLVSELRKLNLIVPESEIQKIEEVVEKYWPDVDKILENYNYFEGYKNKVFYVWFDAPIGYLSFTIEKTKDWKDFWVNPEAKIYHFIGKDNIPFHTIFWPGMILAFNGEKEPSIKFGEIIAKYQLNLPYNVVGMNYLNYEGGKFSKSAKRGIFCDVLPELGLPADVWRFYLATILPENKDSNFSWQEFKERVNKDLIGNFLNFAYRVLSFTWNFFKGEVDGEIDEEVKKKVIEYAKKVDELLSNVEERKAIFTILELSDFGNKYFQSKEPWKLYREGKIDEAKKVIVSSLFLLKALCILMYPFTPTFSEEIIKQMGLNVDYIKWDNIFDERKKWKINKPKILVSMLTDSDIKKMQEKAKNLKDLKDVLGKKEEKNLITIDDFMKVEIRIGKVVKAERLTNKLLKLSIDIGGEIKTSVAGIGEYYKPEDLIGRELVVVTNLKPKKIRGILSEVMILAADADGKPVIIVPEKEVRPGTRVR